MSETWNPVLGFEGFYEVSDEGQVRSLTRQVRHPSGSLMTLRGRPIRQAIQGDGRRSVNLCREGTRRQYHVSTLVLEAFVGRRPRGKECCHKDDDRSNNRLDNLRWDTPKGNVADRIRNGHDGFATRRKCPRGHRLLPPNLVTNRRGRSCLACARTHGWAESRGVHWQDPRWAAEADRRYAEILAGVEPDDPRLRKRCPREHELRAPNLANRPARECLACARTNSWGRRRGIPNDDPQWIAEADRKYAAIMAAA